MFQRLSVRRFQQVARLQPTFDHTPLDPPLPKFEYQDVGLRAKGTENLLKGAHTITTTPAIGSEVRGVQLKSLNSQQLDELALLVAQRGVVFFRDQDMDIDNMSRIGRHFSPLLHVHQTYGIPKDMPHVHVITQEDHPKDLFEKISTSVRWHSDVTYELQPPGITFLAILEMPPNGSADTVWSSQYVAYERLSPSFQKFLEGLTAVHSAKEQADMAIRTGLPLRRDPVINEHPIVRTHPVTKRKALFVNPMFTRYIPQLKQEESQLVLEYIYKHVAVGLDFQARMKWEKNTIAIWDNRCTMHTGLIDFNLSQRRHCVRITPQAERPAL
ncbi:hypothetical protein EDD86DRAFT_215194 [Gorgonomyces haynaldii]|nr:hypothetical protein EDD86DRAFT_215194 [Gorgonomyces haynaldii]